MDFAHGARALDYIERLKAFMAEEVIPGEREYYRALQRGARPWSVPPIMAELKARQGGGPVEPVPARRTSPRADQSGLRAAGRVMGHSVSRRKFSTATPPTPATWKCWRIGSPGNKSLAEAAAGRRDPLGLLHDRARLASSDATNMRHRGNPGRRTVVLNGRKWWSTGIGHPAAALSFSWASPTRPRPKHAHQDGSGADRRGGLKIERMLRVFNDLDEAPYGHGEVSFTNVRLPTRRVHPRARAAVRNRQGRLGRGASTIACAPSAPPNAP